MSKKNLKLFSRKSGFRDDKNKNISASKMN
jgi:hypothetical protein